MSTAVSPLLPVAPITTGVSSGSVGSAPAAPPVRPPDPNQLTQPAPPEIHINVNTLVHDLFLVGATAASIFIKNPASQAQASKLITLLNGLLDHHFPTS